MRDRVLEGKTVAIIVSTDFEEVEMTKPREALEQAGAKTLLISSEKERVQGFNHDERGNTFPVEMSLEEAAPENFDAVLLPGGALNADKIRINKKAQQFVREMNSAHKPIAAICHAPWLLISAKLASGKKLTSFETIQDDIVNAGGIWIDQEVVRDDNVVTSRKPSDIPAFNKEMISLFSRMV